jgi:uncharacterized membrane protein
MYELVHYLHILSAVVYGGGAIAFSFIINPAIMSLPAEMRHQHNKVVQAFGDRLIIPSGVVLIVTGILQVWLSDAIDNISDLYSGYGLVATLSLVTVIVWQVYETPIRGRISRHIENGNEKALIRDSRQLKWTKAVMFPVILGFMFAMRFGYY